MQSTERQRSKEKVRVADMRGEWINIGGYAESEHRLAIVYEYTA